MFDKEFRFCSSVENSMIITMDPIYDNHWLSLIVGMRIFTKKKRRFLRLKVIVLLVSSGLLILFQTMVQQTDRRHGLARFWRRRFLQRRERRTVVDHRSTILDWSSTWIWTWKTLEGSVDAFAIRSLYKSMKLISTF